jgi:hypothetical protein
MNQSALRRCTATVPSIYRNVGSRISPKVIRNGARALFVCGIATIVFAVLFSIVGWPIDRSIPPQSILAGEGATRIVHLETPSPFLMFRADTNEQPTRSNLKLFENGHELGPAHTLHSDIAAKGQGRYSHYGEYLYFSSTDGTDPATNGRRYSFEAILFPSLSGLVALVLAGLALASIGYASSPAQIRDFSRSIVVTLSRARLTILVAVPAIYRNLGSRLSPKAIRNGAQALFVCGIAIIAFAGLFSIVGWTVDHSIPPQSILVGEGATRIVHLKTRPPFLAFRPDTNREPARSNLKLFENGHELGPAHTLHSDIAAKGEGRYSHYGEYLYFSSTDGTDPATNGRRYSFEAILFPSLSGLVALVLAGLALASIGYASSPAQSRDFSRSIVVTLSQARLPILASPLIALAVLIVLDPGTLTKLAYSVRYEVRAALALVMALIAGYAAVGHFPDRPSLWVGAIRALLLLGLSGLLGLRLDEMVWPFGAGLAAGLVFRHKQYHWVESRAITAITVSTSYRRLQIAGVVLALIAILPEVIDYWSESGLWDSNGYDVLAQQIAAGRLPFASSFYMPVYQYGMASLYYAFGHFWEVQKIVNVVFALAAVLILIDVAYILTGSLLAAAIVGIWAAFYENLHHAPWTTQIEGWYIPAFALAIWAAVYYLQAPCLRRMVGLALAAALVFNVRLQGAFFCGAVVMAAFAANRLGLRERLRHALVFILVLFFVGVAPWSVRNLAVEGRFSPSSHQAAQGTAILNDPRIGLYGLRYEGTYLPILIDYMNKFPDAAERQRVFESYLIKRLLSDPGWFVRAAPWRIGAYYGLVPWIYFQSDDASFNWSADWHQYGANHYPFVAMVIAAVLGVAVRWPSRFTLYVIALIGANGVIPLLVGSGEPRLSYPVHMLHVLLALAAFAPISVRYPSFAGTTGVLPFVPRPRILFCAAGAVVLTGLVLHNTFGRVKLYRAVNGEYAAFDPSLTIDRAVPLVQYEGSRETYFGSHLSVNGQSVAQLELGRNYRGVFVATAAMHPPRYVKILDGVPADANDLRLPRFNLFWIGKPQTTSAGRTADNLTPEQLALGLFTGATGAIWIPARLLRTVATDLIREQDIIEAEFRVLAHESYSTTGQFIEIVKAKILRRGALRD